MIEGSLIQEIIVLLIFLSTMVILVYFVGIKTTWIESEGSRKIFISFSFSVGVIGYLSVPGIIESSDNYDVQGILFLYLYIVAFVFIGFFLIGMPISMLSDKIAFTPFRWLKSLLVHISPIFIAVLIVDWRFFAFFPYAFAYWILDEMFKRKIKISN
ncbi:hypothetical protein [Hazenella coriacea]|uniref:Uncharacterized protein n=1 Tax=Hazenella coriacea TaxID=1179467 RepID=A0A4R3L7N4_9BACL|nr:hypothetical protein [Hazenella coriacea]TCS94980.1 hypothetical protein EDD58_103405 [Hazenella coriacea]